MPSVGPMEILLILVIALLVFGPTRLPEVARNLARGIREFRNVARNASRELGVDDLGDDLKNLKDLGRRGTRLDINKELGLDDLDDPPELPHLSNVAPEPADAEAKPKSDHGSETPPSAG